MLRELPADRGRLWISVGPGGKLPVNVWPWERYRDTISPLIPLFDVWPVVVGGEQDRQIGERLIAAWGRAYNAAGSLSLRASMKAIGRCVMHLGNDTGAIHTAAAMKVRCVGVYASRNEPGLWHPYGDGHIVLRTPIECEGCRLIECRERQSRCIRAIEVEPVVKACSRLLRERGHVPLPGGSPQ